MSALSGNRAYARKRLRLTLAVLALGALGLGAFLVLNAFDEALLYFRLPSDVAEQGIEAGTAFRLGGLVESGSVERAEGTTVRFAVTDGETSLPVVYAGILPDLFREGQGVIADGRLGADGVFVADSVLAKHDETYMPKEVYEGIRERGHPAEASAVQ